MMLTKVNIQNQIKINIDQERQEIQNFTIRI